MEGENKDNNLIFSQDNDTVTSADRRVVCDQVAAGFGELEREIFSIGLHIYIFNEPLRQR